MHVDEWRDRTRGRRYYTTSCFQIQIEVDDERIEIGDGGMVDWTARLLDNRKERLCTGALSVERLALACSDAGR